MKERKKIFIMKCLFDKRQFVQLSDNLVDTEQTLASSLIEKFILHFICRHRVLQCLFYLKINGLVITNARKYMAKDRGMFLNFVFCLQISLFHGEFRWQETNMKQRLITYQSLYKKKCRYSRAIHLQILPPIGNKHGQFFKIKMWGVREKYKKPSPVITWAQIYQSYSTRARFIS